MGAEPAGLIFLGRGGHPPSLEPWPHWPHSRGFVGVTTTVTQSKEEKGEVGGLRDTLGQEAASAGLETEGSWAGVLK